MIYIAARVTARHRLLKIKDDLQARGIRVSSSWLTRAQDYPVPREVALEESNRDLREVGEADLLIIDTLDESPTGGREVECGYALALSIPVWRVGPVRNLFHEMAEYAYDSWDDLMKQVIARA